MDPSQDTADAFPTGAWRCTHCGEQVEPAFEVCWRCGADRAGRRDPGFDPAVEKIVEATTCRHCNYPLKGLTTNRCPECGNTFDPDMVDTPRDHATDRHRKILDRASQRAAWILIASLMMLPVSVVIFKLSESYMPSLTAAFALLLGINSFAIFVSVIALIVSLIVARRTRRHHTGRGSAPAS